MFSARICFLYIVSKCCCLQPYFTILSSTSIVNLPVLYRVIPNVYCDILDFYLFIDSLYNYLKTNHRTASHVDSFSGTRTYPGCYFCPRHVLAARAVNIRTMPRKLSTLNYLVNCYDNRSFQCVDFK